MTNNTVSFLAMVSRMLVTRTSKLSEASDEATRL